MKDTIREFKADESGFKEFENFIREKILLHDGDKIRAVCNSKSVTVIKAGKICFLCGGDSAVEAIGNKKYACRDCLRAISKVI